MIQPVGDVESTKSAKALLHSGEYTFDFSKDGDRLQSVRFGSRACIDFERKYHSFVGEAASGRWSTSQNRH